MQDKGLKTPSVFLSPDIWLSNTSWSMWLAVVYEALQVFEELSMLASEHLPMQSSPDSDASTFGLTLQLPLSVAVAFLALCAYWYGLASHSPVGEARGRE